MSPMLLLSFLAPLNPCSAAEEEAGWEEGRGREGAERASGRAFRKEKCGPLYWLWWCCRGRRVVVKLTRVLSSSRVSGRVVVKSGSCELLLLAVCFDREERSRGS